MSTPVFLLSGASFLAGEALDKIRVDEGTDHLSEAGFDSGVEPAQLMSALETPSLLGGRRLVVVHDAHELKKDHLESLERYFASPSPYSVLVLIASGRNAKLENGVKTVGAVITLDPPKGRGLVTWIKQRGAEQRLKIDDRGAWALVDSIGSELRDLDGALSQLATQLGTGARVGAPEVRQAFTRLADERVYAFTDAVGERKLPSAMGFLRRLLEQGDEPLVVLASLNNQVRRMLRARRYADQSAKAVGDAMGMPAWRAERLQKQARSYREEELVSALAMLAELDVDMKKGELQSLPAALEGAVAQIVTGATPARMF
jgi:DNA polymerase-3 subunit delta